MHSATSSEHSGLVRTVGVCVKILWPWRCIVNNENGLLSRPVSLKQSKRLGGLSIVVPIR